LRLLLIANFKPDQQESMNRFCDLLRRGIAETGDEVGVLRPKPVFARLSRRPSAKRKWLGYLDKFLLFPVVLWREVKRYDMIHICDHSNSMYTRFLRGRPHVVTCHDLLAVRSALGEIPENPTGWSGRILQQAILRGLHRAQFVVCVSEHTKRDVLRLAQRDDAVTRCVHNGLNYAYSPMGKAEAWERVRPLLRDRTGSDETKPFFLHVGGNQWYKNRPGVLRIFACLRARQEFSGYRLVMVGKPFTPELRGLVEGGGLGGTVVDLTALSNEDLRALYSLAEGLLFPSLEEGFGWPIVEAQACGCPVFTSNRLPMSEVGGEAAVYFDPCDAVGASEAIAGGFDQRSRMVEQGLKNAARFGADRMLRGYGAVYAGILPGHEKTASGPRQDSGPPTSHR
jgi:glycosyltransferase involved in cell wall biosynthesis